MLSVLEFAPAPARCKQVLPAPLTRTSARRTLGQLELPPVLLGPILRRVEPTRVSVFVATRAPASITLRLYAGVVDAAAPPPELTTVTGQTTRFAAAFHATVITAQLADASALQPGHQFSYDVSVALDGGAAQSLKDLGFLSDSLVPWDSRQPPSRPPVEVQALGYADNRLPSFMTCPAHVEDLVLAHASCRKPHGDGQPALGNLDDYIDDLHGATDGRPHMLFLTGDQIYADDVATALLPGLNSLGIQLLGGVEEIPSPVDGAPLKVNTTTLPAGFRQKVTARSGFTSEDAASHLIGFGEWLAMYCAVWNASLWPVLAIGDTSDPAIPDSIKTAFQQDEATSDPSAERALGRPSPDAAESIITPLYGTDPVAVAALADTRQAFLDDKGTLEDFRREVPKVRRLLANMPTYMICDDHEVTDDWFMTGGIRGNTTGNPFGRSLVRNALAAYCVCQAWGDDPHMWESEAQHSALLSAISGLFPAGWNGGPPNTAAATTVETTLGLARGAQPLMDFSFTVDGPMHRVRVLDTRTRRQYDTPSTPPGLLTRQALDDQLPIQTLPDGNVLVVISPAPVFGPPIIADVGGAIAATVYDLITLGRSQTVRSGQQNLTGLPNGRPSGREAFDVEHWGAHPAAYERFLERLSRYPRVVVLAGDVHYAAAYAMDWTAPPGSLEPRTARIVHFTSSAARNAWVGVVRNLMGLNGMSTGLQKLGLPLLRLGWNNTLPEVVTGLSQEPPLTRIRVQTGPVLLSNEMFRQSHALQRPPDWLWRAQPVFDARAPADRPPAARVPQPANDLPDGAAAVHAYADAATLHVQALRTAAIARGLQFLNNAGLITFATAADGLHVKQSLYSLRPRPDPNEKSAAYIVHDVRLEADPVTVPAAVGPGA